MNANIPFEINPGLGKTLISKKSDGKGYLLVDDDYKKINNRNFEKLYNDHISKFPAYAEVFGNDPSGIGRVVVDSELPIENPVYSGAEGKPLHVTLLPNIISKRGTLVFGCTMGHTHPPGKRKIQEIYRVFGPGAFLIDKPDEPSMEFVYAEEGDFVFVPTNCNMTIYNLGCNPLVTLDVADRREGGNPASKDLQKSDGPPLLIRMDTKGEKHLLKFVLNEKYIDREDEFGVKKVTHDKETFDADICGHFYAFARAMENLGIKARRSEFKGSLRGLMEETDILHRYFGLK